MDEFELQIESLAYQGPGIGRTNAGKTVFVTGAAPGDTVRVRTIADKKSFLEAELIEVLQSGPARVEASCPYAGLCGGCQWQHIAYSEQLFAKRSAVLSALARIGHIPAEKAEILVGECVPSKREMGYRNKLELACGHNEAGRLVLGYHKEGSTEIVPIDACPLAHSAIANTPKAIQGALRYMEGTSDLGIFRVGVRHSMRTKSCEIALWTTPGAFPRAAVAKTLGSAVKASSIVRVIADEGKARKIKQVEVLEGHGFWEEELGEFDFRISAPSFFQVNTAQAETLQRLVLEGLAVENGSVVADLYAGPGTFSLPLASRAGSCLAVESAGSAVRDLRRNAESAGVWVDVIGGDSARELPELGALDALVVDPPRSGLAEGVAESIAEAGPERLAYVSCDPATLARDTERLQACGYTLERATPVDLFPQTYHIETVALFTRK